MTNVGRRWDRERRMDDATEQPAADPRLAETVALHECERQSAILRDFIDSQGPGVLPVPPATDGIATPGPARTATTEAEALDADRPGLRLLRRMLDAAAWYPTAGGLATFPRIWGAAGIGSAPATHEEWHDLIAIAAALAATEEER
jgi:hypothetical protein